MRPIQFFGLVIATGLAAVSWAASPDPGQAELRKIYQQLIEINTTLSAGIPTYGVSGLFKDPAEVNAHGLNEKLPVTSLYESQEFLDRLIRIYAGGE
jgi:hypothetical protein